MGGTAALMQGEEGARRCRESTRGGDAVELLRAAVRGGKSAEAMGGWEARDEDELRGDEHAESV